MVILKFKFYLSFVLILAINIVRLYAQNNAYIYHAIDTIYVLYDRPSDFKRIGYSETFFINKDTCYVKKNHKYPLGKPKYFDNLDNTYNRNTYYIFVNKKNVHLIAEGIYDSENFVGKCLFYYRNGKLKSSGYYEIGDQKVGTWEFYRKNGKLKHTIEYLNENP